MIYTEGLYSSYLVELDKEDDKHVCSVYITLGKLYNDSGKWKNLYIKIKTFAENDLIAYQKAIETTSKLYALKVDVLDDMEKESLNAIVGLSDQENGVEVTAELGLEDTDKLHE